MGRATSQGLERVCKMSGLTVSTWSPGDGYTRYRLNWTADVGERCGYTERDGIFTGGLREAIAFASGVRAAMTQRLLVARSV